MVWIEAHGHVTKDGRIELMGDIDIELLKKHFAGKNVIVKIDSGE